MGNAKLADIAQIMKILGDPSRLAIFNLLMQGVQCNCELGNKLNLPMNLISHHLKVLRVAGWVNAARDPTDARWIYYSVNDQVLEQLRGQLNQFLDARRIQPRQPVCGPHALAKKPPQSYRSMTNRRQS